VHSLDALNEIDASTAQCYVQYTLDRNGIQLQAMQKMQIALVSFFACVNESNWQSSG
jgi:hypothetical protein